MSEYTPTTGHIRDFWATGGTYIPAAKGQSYEECFSEFDRWLAKHDAELVARTLAAQSTGGVCKVFDAGLAWQDWVEDAGALINGEETNEL